MIFITDSTPLPSWLHSPLHSSLLVVGHGVEGGLVGVRVLGDDVGVLGCTKVLDGRGASIDDMMEFSDHPPPSET